MGSRPLEEDEQALVRRAKAGDANAYARLVKMHEAIVFRVAYVVSDSAEDAEEAGQEALVKAWRALDRFRSGEPLRPWLLAIVANEAHNRRRVARRHGALALRAAEEGRPGAAAPSPEATLLDAERRREVLDAVNSLAEPDREVITYRYFLELSEKETAGVLGVRRGTVKSRLSRALVRLRQRMEAAG